MLYNIRDYGAKFLGSSACGRGHAHGKSGMKYRNIDNLQLINTKIRGDFDETDRI